MMKPLKSFSFQSIIDSVENILASTNIVTVRIHKPWLQSKKNRQNQYKVKCFKL